MKKMMFLMSVLGLCLTASVATLAAAELKTAIVSTGKAILFPDINGSKVVWQDNRTGTNDIFLYDSASGKETRLTSAGGIEHQKPRI